MKLNVDTSRLRLRLSEDELGRLIKQGSIEQIWSCPDGSSARCVLRLMPSHDAAFCGGNMQALDVRLPHQDFVAFAAERPRRDGFTFVQGDIRVSVEVDVRDSHRRRSAQSAEQNIDK